MVGVCRCATAGYLHRPNKQHKQVLLWLWINLWCCLTSPKRPLQPHQVNRNLNSARHRVSKSTAASSVKETGSCTSCHLDRWMKHFLVIPLKIYTFITSLPLSYPLYLCSHLSLFLSFVLCLTCTLYLANEFFLLVPFCNFFLSNCCFSHFLPLHFVFLSCFSSLWFYSLILLVIWWCDTASCLRPLEDF